MGEAASGSFIINVLTFDLMKILFCTLLTSLPTTQLSCTAFIKKPHGGVVRSLEVSL